jgi:hypothetical protein
VLLGRRIEQKRGGGHCRRDHCGNNCGLGHGEVGGAIESKGQGSASTDKRAQGQKQRGRRQRAPVPPFGAWVSGTACR